MHECQSELAGNNSVIEYEWFFDGMKVAEGYFSPLDTTLRTATVMDSTNRSLYRVYAFTTDDGFIEFGDTNGFNHRGLIEFENEVEVALQNGEPSDELLGRIYERSFGKGNGARFLPGVGFDFCGPSDYSSSTPLRWLMPFFVKSWRNRISAVEGPTSIRYGFAVYSLPFWPRRSHRGTFWFWGGPNHPSCLPWHMDNVNRSTIKWF